MAASGPADSARTEEVSKTLPQEALSGRKVQISQLALLAAASGGLITLPGAFCRCSGT